jgi:hypothetical protein
MSNVDIKTSALTVSTSLSDTDRFVVVRNPSNSALATTNAVSLSTIRASIPIANTPANSTALTVKAGTLLYDSGYLYVAVANNIIKRAQLSTF